MRFCAEAWPEHGNRLHRTEEHDYHFEPADDLIGRPLGRLNHPEPDPLERRANDAFAAVGVDDEHCALFHGGRSSSTWLDVFAMRVPVS